MKTALLALAALMSFGVTAQNPVMLKDLKLNQPMKISACKSGTQGKRGFEIPTAEMSIRVPQVQLKREIVTDPNKAKEFAFALLRGSKVVSLELKESPVQERVVFYDVEGRPALDVCEDARQEFIERYSR